MRVRPLHHTVKSPNSWPDGTIKVTRPRGERLIAKGLAEEYVPDRKAKKSKSKRKK